MDVPAPSDMQGQEEKLTFWMRDPDSEDFLFFEKPAKIYFLDSDADRDTFVKALKAAELESEGKLFFAGAIAYEAWNWMGEASGLPQYQPDSAARPGPVAIAGLFAAPQRISVDAFLDECESIPMMPVTDVRMLHRRGGLLRSMEVIRERIRSGHVYQANFTFPIGFNYPGSPYPLFASLYRAQPARYASGLVYTGPRGSTSLLSVSPELFFRSERDGLIYCQPMKGTASRSGQQEADQHAITYLKTSEKERAENAMIVDLIRNDLGKICRFGSIKVNRPFHVEPLPTVFQMTTEVMGELRENRRTPEIFHALFPCGSVTGAPKRSAMELLHRLEARDPESAGRGYYTGSMGWSGAGGACWNVAIRTVELRSGTGVISVGSGITYDSDVRQEFRECFQKLRFFRNATELPDDFFLYETMLYRSDRMERRMLYLDDHLDRLRHSAQYFSLPCSLRRIRIRLRRLDHLLQIRAGKLSRIAESGARLRIHMRLLRNGRLRFQIRRVLKEGRATLHCRIARAKSLAVAPYLCHKSSVGRAFYEKSTKTAHIEAIYCNEREQITESGIYNIFCCIDGQWKTPPLEAGLLPGILRERLIKRFSEHIQVANISETDLRNASSIVLVNSVRGMRRAVLVHEA